MTIKYTSELEIKAKIMKKLIKTIITISVIFLSGIFLSQKVKAIDNLHVATYLTGIGCPHCSNVAPGLLKEKVNECNDMIVIEYEVYKNPQNSSVIFEFNSNYGTGLGIPQVIFSKDSILVGDRQINANIDVRCEETEKGVLCLPNGNCFQWEDFTLNDLPMYPNIWSKDKIAIRKEVVDIDEETNSSIKEFLTSDNPAEVVTSNNWETVNPEEVEISGGEVEFKNATLIGGWLLQWNGDTQEVLAETEHIDKTETSSVNVSLGKTITLALADSVNPCAIAILMMMLIAITTYNPGNKKAVLLTGLSFVSAVLVMYLIYGILIVKFFDIIQNFKNIQAIVTPILSLVMGIFALILGGLEIKDYFSYKPGALGTEMPMNLRPKVQKLISKITSPTGAFVLGLFVTIFLLPCTIGPYFILGGLISTGSTNVLSMLPYLGLYNIIFVLPMVVVTCIIFFGVKNIEDIKDWKDNNVRILHLIAGILLCILAIWVMVENFSGILSLFNL
jgi:cytochrome c biogenesis protein CcdA